MVKETDGPQNKYGLVMFLEKRAQVQPSRFPSALLVRQENLRVSGFRVQGSSQLKVSLECYEQAEGDGVGRDHLGETRGYWKNKKIKKGCSPLHFLTWFLGPASQHRSLVEVKRQELCVSSDRVGNMANH